MKPGGSPVLAIGVGYVLGRQHKLRTALMLGAAAAGGKLAASRGQAKSQKGGEQGGQGSGLLGKLGGAGKTAAIGALTRSADKLGDALTERAASMRKGGSGGDEK